MSCSFGQIWLVTSGACTPSLTSARTVIAMSRLRRHRLGALAHGVGGGADDAELHREAHRRAEIEAVDAYARFAQGAVGDRVLDLGLDPLARLDVFGDDHDLGERLVRQLRVQAQPEARRA